jgi:hypothetical protein
VNATTELQLVRVWFGRHPIAAYHADKELADRYTAAMGPNFAGLHVTTERAAAGDAKQLLPNDERQWALTAFGGGGH